MNIEGMHILLKKTYKILFNKRNILKKINFLYLKLFFNLILFCLLIIYLNSFKLKNNNNLDSSFINEIINNNENIHLDYDNNTFVIIKRGNCRNCGLFSDYIVFLGCINKYINQGIIPIIDLKSYKNIFNGFKVNLSSENPWEIFFYQPFGYSLNNVLMKGKKIQYYACNSMTSPNYSIFFNKILMDFFHNLALKYIPVKIKILLESELIRKNLFKKSKNVLGILMRGTDYISRKPRSHPIPPTTDIAIKDIREMDDKNNYDWLFISTEDDLIREIFVKQLGSKLKYYIYNKKINYNYKKKKLLAYNKNIKGNINFIKVYLLNMIILSKCIDIICAMTSGSLGVFIFTKGFRNSKVYNIGFYKRKNKFISNINYQAI